MKWGPGERTFFYPGWCVPPCKYETGFQHHCLEQIACQLIVSPKYLPETHTWQSMGAGMTGIKHKPLLTGLASQSMGKYACCARIHHNWFFNKCHFKSLTKSQVMPRGSLFLFCFMCKCKPCSWTSLRMESPVIKMNCKWHGCSWLQRRGKTISLDNRPCHLAADLE